MGAFVGAGVSGWVGRALIVDVSAGAETASLGVASAAGTGLVWDGEFDSEGCGLVDGDGVAVEVAGLVGPAAGGDSPGSAGHFAGDGGGG